MFLLSIFSAIQFLGCSEAKYKHDYGCDRDLQNVEVKDKSDKKIQVQELRYKLVQLSHTYFTLKAFYVLCIFLQLFFTEINDVGKPLILDITLYYLPFVSDFPVILYLYF